MVMVDSNKIQEELQVEEWEIETPEGWKPLTTIYLTIPFRVYTVTTHGGLSFQAADTHRVFNVNYECVYVENLIPNHSYIQTCNGVSQVVSIQKESYMRPMYDVTVDSYQHTYYGNGVVHGNSTTVISYFLHFTLFNENKKVAILANKASMAKKLLSDYKFAYERLPFWIQEGVVEWNKTSIELENGCRVLASSTSGSSIRGETINLVLLDEFAFVPMNIADEFYSATYPTISSGTTTKIFVISTPNGMNHFYKMWKKAEQKSSGYVPFHVPWWKIPGRDEQWKEEQLANMTEEQFDAEYGCEFQGAENTLISGAKLRTLVGEAPVYDENGLFLAAHPIKYNTKAPIDPKNKDHVYVIVADASEGKNQDLCAFSVFDVTDYPFKQVARYHSPTDDYVFFAGVVERIAKQYNNAFVLIETKGVGHSVAHVLWEDLEYENLIFPFGENSDDMGVSTNKKIKRIGCLALKTLVEKDQLILSDLETIIELATFVKSKKGSYEAKSGFHDDKAMCCVLFAWFTTLPMFEDLTDKNYVTLMKEKTQARLEEEMPSAGFFITGMEDESDVWTEWKS